MRRAGLESPNHVRKWLATEGRWEDYWYPWKGNGAPRLPGKPGSPEFEAAYHAAWADRRAAENAGTGIKPETLSWLIEKFLKSQHYQRFDERTKKQYDWIVPSIENEFGDMPLRVLKDRRTRAVFIEWRDSIADGTCETLVSRQPENRPRIASTSMADRHLQKLAAILNRAFKVGWIDANPLKEVEPVHRSSRLDKIWTWEHEEKFLAGARRDLAEAYLTAVWTGLREGDIVDLRVSEYDGEFIRRELEKRARDGTRKRVMIPVGGPLKPVLDAMVRRTGAAAAGPETQADTIILRNSRFRQPWANGQSFYGQFKRECVRLGIKDRTFHDLRRTAVVRLAIAGCTEPEIASITGHSIKDVKSVLEKHYLYLDPQIAMNAMRKLENSTRGVYGQLVRQLLERGFKGTTIDMRRPTDRPTALHSPLFVRRKA